VDRYRRKVIGPSVGYRVELTAEFTFTINEVVVAPSGASSADLEELIGRSWWWISGNTDVAARRAPGSWRASRNYQLLGRLAHTTKAQPFQKAPIRSFVR
jgi:hypothetical protein